MILLISTSLADPERIVVDLFLMKLIGAKIFVEARAQIIADERICHHGKRLALNRCHDLDEILHKSSSFER